MIDKWLIDNNYLIDPLDGCEKSINAWVMPVNAEVIAKNEKGVFFKIKFSIGTVFRNRFNKEIECIEIFEIDA
ncbi:hypothetical protein HA050_01725 [Iodobacter sp. HSC-16F04]|uniref:Phage protein n=1 Tax=Iodobacter violaceini TaxID=3044271 RepID=A0ABX0KQX3_9NEIS|nr:hypothetical protein [Iodobacter violacea]NHQ84832.1 hypothetical protein [Iodobacter violacea]